MRLLLVVVVVVRGAADEELGLVIGLTKVGAMIISWDVQKELATGMRSIKQSKN